MDKSLDLTRLIRNFHYTTYIERFNKWNKKYQEYNVVVKGTVYDHGIKNKINFNGKYKGSLVNYPNYCGGLIIAGVQDSNISINYMDALKLITEFAFIPKISQVFLIYSLSLYGTTANNSILKELKKYNFIELSNFTNKKTRSSCKLFMKNNPNYV